MTNFANYFSLESYEKLFNYYKKDKDFFHKEVEKFVQSMLLFLQEKNQHESLTLLDQEHDTEFKYAWNHLVQNKPIKHNVFDFFEEYFSILLITYWGTLTKDQDGSTMYENLVERINEGNFSWQECFIKSSCGYCGQRMITQFQQWKPSYVSLDFNSGTHHAPEECKGKSIVELEIEFKSNKLLVADWFRIEEFTNQVRFKGNINYSIEREKSTRYSVEQWNYITVHVKKSSKIIQHGNNYLFGNEKEDEKLPSSYKYKGSISTTLWNITLIEKQQLIHIVANELGQEKAEQIVEEYLKEKEGEYEEIDITPGVYILRFHPTYLSYQEEETKDIPKEMEVYFTLSKK